MPTYEYACRSCDAHLEVVQRFDDEPLSSCPSCGGALRKVFGSIGIAFKGSGFYKTDSRSSAKSDAKRDKAGADKGGASEKGGGDKGGGDKKGDGSTAGGKDAGGKEGSGSKRSGDTASSSSPAKRDSPAKSA